VFKVLKISPGFDDKRENHPVSRNGCHPSFVRRGAFKAKIQFPDAKKIGIFFQIFIIYVLT
jgi:hypothetical protein